LVEKAMIIKGFQARLGSKWNETETSPAGLSNGASDVERVVDPCVPNAVPTVAAGFAATRSASGFASFMAWFAGCK